MLQQTVFLSAYPSALLFFSFHIISYKATGVFLQNKLIPRMSDILKLPRKETILL
jgi:hypothetical protein